MGTLNALPRDPAFILQVIKHHWTIWNWTIKIQLGFCFLLGVMSRGQRPHYYQSQVPTQQSASRCPALTLHYAILISPQEVVLGQFAPRSQHLEAKKWDGDSTPSSPASIESQTKNESSKTEGMSVHTHLWAFDHDRGSLRSPSTWASSSQDSGEHSRCLAHVTGDLALNIFSNSTAPRHIRVI